MIDKYWKREAVLGWERTRKLKLNHGQRQYITCMLFEHIKEGVDNGSILVDSVGDLSRGYLSEQLDKFYPLLPVELSDDWSPEDIYKEHPDVFPSLEVTVDK